MRPLLAAAAVLAALPGAPLAAPTVACHCFKDRSFDPADPGSADAYILATTRSSLLSATFGAGKGGLVRAVMNGVAPDDLWIAHFAGARLGRGAPGLLEEKGAKGSWKAALAGADLPPAFAKALAAGAGDAALAALAVDEVLVARLGASAEDVAALRASRARSEEVVLAAVLAVRGKTAGMPLLARVRSGGATWGTTLRDAGLAPEDMDAVVRAAVR